MRLDNQTPFAALSYDIVDSKREEFHVIVARGSYDLRVAPPAAAGDGLILTHDLELSGGALCFSDAYHGEMNRSSVKYESDLAQRKPRCDVIVVGAAHSPTGAAVERVDVAVRIRRLGAILNVAEPGTLLEHFLAVHGARAFERRGKSWRRTEPEPFVELPLRYEHAFGGELKVYAGDEAARRLDDAHRLSEEARRQHPEGEAAPVAHTTCEYNPVGTGHLEGWYAEAAEVERWPAPRIEAPGAGITAEIFEKMLEGEVRPGQVPELSPRGVGVIAKPWRPRLGLAGTLDERWLDERWPYMPDDFDMAYWNGAHPDMQCEHLFGIELVELWNVLPRSAPGALPEIAGTACRFFLPGTLLGAGYTTHRGTSTGAVVPIDTLIIDLEEMRVSTVWRTLVPASIDQASLRMLDAAAEP